MCNEYLERMFSPENLAIVVAGASGTLGGAIAAAIAAAGGRVMLWGRNKQRLSANADSAAQASPDPSCVASDVVDTSTVEAVQAGLERAAERLGQVHVFVNCVGGVTGKSTLVELDLRQFEQTWRMNLEAGCLIPMKAAAKYFIAHNIAGSIINIASMAAHRPLSGVWGYNAAKAAVVSLTKLAARELASHNIRVNAISPGFFLSQANRKLLWDDVRNEPTERGKAVLARTPMGRFGEPAELGGAVLFLACPASSFVTGAVIPVDGGFLTDSV